MSPDYAPTTNSEAKTMVRGLTQYDDTADEIPNTTLDTQLKIAKLRIHNRVGSDQFYSDPGLGQALVGTTAILAKAAIENYSVTRWRIGDQEIETSDFQNPDAAQFSFWNELVNEGLAASDATPEYAPSNTTAYIGGN